ncbi:hypothetical protein [Cellvibrio mixtus]|uniref:hypothetical protein n=1 Tax=Cellvibrio mixtus TaxID=39650 RepID=UPI00058742A1|nr:hypothetical protein [Cellvibrio mixtus]
MENFSFEKYDFTEIVSRLDILKMRLGEADKNMVDIIIDTFNTIKLNTKHWDDACVFTKKKYAKILLNCIAHIDSNDFRITFNGIILSVYAFYEESKYWSDDHTFSITDPGINFARLVASVNSTDVYNGLIPEFDSIKDEVYRETVRSKVNNETFQKIYDEVNDRDNVLKEVGTLSSYLESKTQLVEALDKKISELRTEYNFVGLYKGFEDLFKRKAAAKKDSLKFVYMLSGFLILVPFLIVLSALVIQVFYFLNTENYLTLLKFIGLPLISIEIFLLYCFRLKYAEVKSIDAQLLQLELRMSLCQFVESYSTFAAEIHKDNPNLLSSFESIVFSPIVANESDIPPLIDGANQLVELVSKVRK